LGWGYDVMFRPMLRQRDVRSMLTIAAVYHYSQHRSARSRSLISGLRPCRTVWHGLWTKLTLQAKQNCQSAPGWRLRLFFNLLPHAGAADLHFEGHPRLPLTRERRFIDPSTPSAAVLDTVEETCACPSVRKCAVDPCVLRAVEAYRQRGEKPWRWWGSPVFG